MIISNPNINVESQQQLTLLIFQIKIKTTAPTNHLIVVALLWLTLENFKMVLRQKMLLENPRVVKMTLKISPMLLNLYMKLSKVSEICQPLNLKNQIKWMEKRVRLNLFQNINEANQALLVLENVFPLQNSTRKMPFHFLFL